MPDRVLIIGGNAAGMTAASRARRLDPSLKITILEKSRFISYSICGLPYYVERTVDGHQQLITFTPERLQAERGIEARTSIQVESIQHGRRLVVATDLNSGQELTFAYDRLVLATGYTPKASSLDGGELENVFTVSRLEDGIRLRHLIEERKPRRALVVGGGYIGLMMASVLRRLNLEVLLAEGRRHIFSQVDEPIAEILEEELRRNGVDVRLESPVERLVAEGGRLKGVCLADREMEIDLALVDVGVGPNVQLAEVSGVQLGVSGAIQVDQRGQTNVPGVFAAGNCAETRHLVSGRPIFSTLGSAAARQGRAVGENLAGVYSVFPGTLETAIEKVFQTSVGRTGLTLREAHKSGFDADSVFISSRSKAAYFPGSGPMHVQLVFEKKTSRLLGGQIAGDDPVAKRIDTLVTALTAGFKLRDLAQLDLGYAPPYATLWDPLQIAANVALRGGGGKWS